MACQSFLENKLFEDLKIVAIDGELFVSKSWLCRVSPYFRATFKGNFMESEKTVLNLPHRSKILEILFQVVTYAYSDEKEYAKENFFAKLLTVEDVCDFLSVANEYLFLTVKKSADKYFSTETHIQTFFSAKLVITIHELTLSNMWTQCMNLLISKKLALENLKFDMISCDTLNFFRMTTGIYLFALEQWSKHNDPTDKELVHSKIFFLNHVNYNNTTIPGFLKIVSGFTKAPETKAAMNEVALNVLYPTVLCPDQTQISYPLLRQLKRHKQFIQSTILNSDHSKAEQPISNNDLDPKHRNVDPAYNEHPISSDDHSKADDHNLPRRGQGDDHNLPHRGQGDDHNVGKRKRT
jgi:hypothetical protein